MAHRSIATAALSSALNGTLLLVPLCGLLYASGQPTLTPSHQAEVLRSIRTEGGACTTPGCTLLERLTVLRPERPYDRND